MRHLQAILTGLCGLFLLLCFLPGMRWAGFLAVGFGSVFALQAAYESLKERSIDVDQLMVLAAIGAVIVGRPEDAAALLFLFSLSGTLEEFALGRTRSAIEGLVKLRPSTASLLTSEGEVKVPAEQLKIGDRIRVAPFEALPVDGEIVSGLSTLDQSAMTGESVPVPCEPGDHVLAGTQNMEGSLVVSVSAPVGSSTLDKVVELVQDAQENKASGERISDWFGQRYTIFVLSAFILALAIRLALHQPWNGALYGALTLLVALSPCALVISTPATTLSALAWAARQGILVRGGEFIERAGKIKVVALDKTGTLTSGRPALKKIVTCPREMKCVVGGPCPAALSSESVQDHANLLSLAAAVEQYASHPIAGAVLAAAKSNRVAVPEGGNPNSVPGKGARALVDGKPVLVGRESFLIEEGIVLSGCFQNRVQELKTEGHTVALVATETEIGVLAFADEVRPESKALINDLRTLGVGEVAMLTGDNAETARSVAAPLGIDSVHAGLLPDGKTECVTELRKHGALLMVGDGINDAPSLAIADIGVAMGGLGSDIALNAADVVLMRDRLDGIPKLIRLGRKTNGIIRANLIFASSVIIGLTVSSFVTTLPLPIAVIGHEGSTVLVILNGLRLLRGVGK